MALQSSGEIRFSQIRDEFGESGPGSAVSLGRYRKNSIHFTNKVIGRDVNNRLGSYSNYLPLDINCGPNADTPIGETGQIKATDFYNGRLNMVVDFYSGNTDTRLSVRTIYDNDNNGSTVKCIGGFRFRPSSTANKRVIVYVAKKIGSEIGGANRCALRTSSNWQTNTQLEFEIGPAGEIYGAGGDGGDGGSADGGAGGDGADGSSALGIEYAVTKINNLGRIQAGYGGGGGGGGKRDYRRSGKKSGRWVGSTGGGGGAGAGYPNATGGDSPTGSYGGGSDGSDGGDGTDRTSGALGAGGAEAGDGGAGQVVNNSSSKGADGAVSGGTGGNGGYAIITSQGSLPTITGNSVVGRTATSTNPA